ncbi:MAG: methyltransferase domain-containing protein [Anaerolineales bacterium]|nr:methyltransferase domain-containing protein [Anaerolineales bacterium]
MRSFFNTILRLIVLLGLIALTWRFFSRRSSIPCPTWLSWLVELDNPFFKNYSARAIMQHLALEPGMKVLDCGCGPGRLTIPVAKEVGPAGQVTAFDIQPGMLQRVRDKVEAENLSNVQFVQGGAGEGKLGRNQYDRALLVTVLGEIPDQKAALAEIFESLKRGGILSVTEVIADPHFQRRDSVIRAANSVGFVEKDFFGNRLSYTINFEKS